MVASLVTGVELALAPADHLRRRALKCLGPLASPLMNRRELRVAIMGAGVVAFALVGTVAAPLWLLALGPIVLGIPHILSDVRYLWVRPGLDRRLAACVAIGGPLVAGLAVGRLWAGFVAIVGAVAVARTTPLRRAVGLALACGLVALVWRGGRMAEIVFAHVHNLVAIALWWRWRPRANDLHLLPLGLFLAGCAVLVALDPFALFAGTPRLGPSFARHLGTLAPAGIDRALGAKLVLLFCFAQSVHYGIWLRLVPEEDRPRPTPRTFAASFRALLADLGPVRLVVFGLMVAALAVWAAFDLTAARGGYMRFAVFHGQLELAAAALLWAERREGARACAAG